MRRRERCPSCNGLGYVSDRTRQCVECDERIVVVERPKRVVYDTVVTRCGVMMIKPIVVEATRKPTQLSLLGG